MDARLQRTERTGRMKPGMAMGGAALLFSVALIACGFQISNTALPDAAQGVTYTTTLSATGGPVPYTWAVTAGALPPGLSLNTGTGTITGTPPTLGTSTFDVKVTASDNTSTTQSLSIRVVVPGTWAQVNQDEGRRAWAGAEKSVTPANVSGVHEEWTVSTYTSPPVTTGGLGYVNGLLPASNDPALMAYDVSTSELMWSVPLASSCSAGAVALTGIAVLSSCGTGLEAYRLAAPHDLLWTTVDTDPGANPSSLLVTGSLVVASNQEAVTAYDAATGERQWQQLSPNFDLGSMAAGGGKVVVTFSDRMRAFNLADGSQAWEQIVGVGSRVVVADGWAYVSVNGRITRYRVADGNHGWTAPADPDGFSAEGVFAVDGTTVYSYWTVYDFGSDTLVLRALKTTDGTQRWRQFLPTRLQSLAVVGDLVWATLSEAGIYGGQFGQLDAYSIDDGTTLASVPFDSRVSGGTAFANGHALVVTYTSLKSIGLAAPVPTITNKALRSGRVGTAYSEQLAAAAGTPPFSWTVVSGSLPAGVTISTAGVLSGTPTASSSPLVTFRVTDAASRIANRALVVQIAPSGGTSAWPTAGVDASRNPLNVPETMVGLDHAVQMANRWRTAAVAGTPNFTPEPISIGGRLYATGPDGALRAWTSTGSATNRVPLWTTVADPGELFVSAPTESAGTIYLVGSDAAVYAIRSSDGVRLWRTVTEPGISGANYNEVAAPLVSGGKVVVDRLNSAGVGLDVWALTASTGALAWGGTPRNLPGNQGSFIQPPTVASDGTRVYAVVNCQLSALNLATGAPAWDRTIDVNGQSDCNPYLSTLGVPTVVGGVVYAGSFGTTAAFDAPTGNVRWRVRQGSSGGFAVSNGVVVISLVTNIDEFGWTLAPAALDARNGAFLWSNLSWGSTGPPSVAGDLVLFGSYTDVNGFDIRTGTKVWDSGTVSTQNLLNRPVIAATRIFVPSADGTIRALGPP